MNAPEVSILIPNFKTLKLTRLCLALLRKFTDLQRVRIIVIDNDSRDESLDWLRGLSWIELIEREATPPESPPLSHARALDLGLERVDTPYVLSMHTDTFVKHGGWLDFLLSRLNGASDIAGVGSWKLENKPFYKRFLKRLENHIEGAYFNLTGKEDHRLAGKGKNIFYLRSHCALYRTELIRRYRLQFAAGAETAGKMLHRKLVEHGYRMLFLPSHELCRYVVHLNHATSILHPELGVHRRTIRKGRRRFQKELRALGGKRILEADQLEIT